MEKFDLLDINKKSDIMAVARGNRDTSFVESLVANLSQEEIIIFFEKCAEWGNVNILSYMMDNIPNSHEIFYNTGALATAVEYGHDEAVSKLLEFGVNTNYPEREYGRTAMENAIIFNRKEIYDKLYDIVDLNVVNKNYDTYPQIMLKSLRDNAEYGSSEEPEELYATFSKLVFDTKANINNLNNENETVFDLFQKNKEFFDSFSDIIEEEMFNYGIETDKNILKEININKSSKNLAELYLKLEDLKTKNNILDKKNKKILSVQFKNTEKHLNSLFSNNYKIIC